MKQVPYSFAKMLATVPPQIQQEIKMEFAISDRIYDLMVKHNLNKKQLAQAVGKRPSEVTKWLSGQHNFTIKTLALLSSFFGEPIVHVQ